MVVAIRGALDIGSGQHKLLIAAVDTVSRRIVRKIHLDQAGVLLGHSLVQSADGRLDEAILEDSRSVFDRFAAAGREHGATEWAGVCTAVFRRASNGEEHLARANAELGLNLNLIEQKLEGELGYLAASSGCEASAEQLVAWDSGSGSFQVSSRAGDGALKVWEGPIGDSDVTAALVRDVQKRDFAGGGKVGQRASPNPVSLTQAEQLSALLLDARIPPPPEWVAAACAAPDAVLVGFGEKTSIFSHAAKLIGADEFGAAEVWSAIERVAGRSDAELKAAHGLDNEEDLIMPKLVLLHAMLNRLGASRVRNILTMGNCEGVLLCDELWS